MHRLNRAKFESYLRRLDRVDTTREDEVRRLDRVDTTREDEVRRLDSTLDATNQGCRVYLHRKRRGCK